MDLGTLRDGLVIHLGLLNLVVLKRGLDRILQIIDLIVVQLLDLVLLLIVSEVIERIKLLIVLSMGVLLVQCFLLLVLCHFHFLKLISC